MSTVLRGVCALVVLLLVGSVAQRAGRVAASPLLVPRTIVVAELFTSEGCSSCPPADEVLSGLAHLQPIPDVDVLALGEHVDYWDRLGWRDPFSAATFSTRQSDYDDKVFHTKRIYTPQLVVDGQFERVGSEAAAVQAAIAQAAQRPKADVSVRVARATDQRELHIEAHVNVPPALVISEAADLVVAVTEDRLVTDVRRGENRGRLLKHSAVVRSLTTAATFPAQTPRWSTVISIPWVPAWKSADVRVIAFIQERTSRRIVGAGSTTLEEQPRAGWTLLPSGPSATVSRTALYN